MSSSGSSRHQAKNKSAEKALEDFLKDYVNSGQLDADLAELPPSQRLQAVTRLLPYCLPKAKESDKEKDSVSTGDEALSLFFARLEPDVSVQTPGNP